MLAEESVRKGINRKTRQSFARSSETLPKAGQNRVCRSVLSADLLQMKATLRVSHRLNLSP